MKKHLFVLLMAAMLMLGGCGGSGAVQEEKENPIATEMQAELQSYDAELTAADAAEAGMFVIEGGKVVGGQENWDAFYAGEAESVIICQFSLEGGAMLDYVAEQTDGSYVVVSDLTRDGYDFAEKEDYKIQEFKHIKVFEEFRVQEGGTAYTVCVMTDDENLDAATFLSYWQELSYEENGAFMLFVI
ncbi:MAG: hypothetical protein Q4C06_07525 [Bacillota bacterium]|nr:hypothetical protein [Bacillota bacterium]